MNDLHDFPSLVTFGQRLDELIRRDAECSAPAPLARRFRRISLTHLQGGVRFAMAVGLLIVAVAGTYATPVTRAAVDDVYGAFSDWIAGGESAAPGHAASAADIPSWIAESSGEKRILASAGGDQLVAVRDGEKLTFGLSGFGTTDTITGWSRSLEGRRIVLVGPGRFVSDGRHDLRPVFGVVSSLVKRIQFNYVDGAPPVVEDHLSGAFGIVIEVNRRPQSLTGYDDQGNLIATVPLLTDPRELRAGQIYADFRYCPDAASGCPPWTS